MKILLSFSIVIIFLAASCVKNNPDPSWLEVNEWVLEVNPLASVPAGELTEAISDAWVYVDNDLIGVFEVPFRIPILKEGTMKVLLYPTVLNNGIAATKKIYPFLEPYEFTGELIQNQTLTLTPVTRYYSNTQFSILDFEDANLGFDHSPSSLATLTGSNDPLIIQPFNGNQFGRVYLDAATNVWLASTNLDETLPGGGAEVYLEIDYYATNNFTTGVLAIDGAEVTQNPNVQVNSSDTPEWKKIYIELKTIVSGSPLADFFEHSFQAVLEEGLTSSTINIDNVKVIHF